MGLASDAFHQVLLLDLHEAYCARYTTVTAPVGLQGIIAERENSILVITVVVVTFVTVEAFHGLLELRRDPVVAFGATG